MIKKAGQPSQIPGGSSALRGDGVSAGRPHSLSMLAVFCAFMLQADRRLQEDSLRTVHGPKDVL